jgi:hypothetical protein
MTKINNLQLSNVLKSKRDKQVSKLVKISQEINI